MNDKDREPKIHPTVYVDKDVQLGDWSVINAGARIYGDVKIGRAAWIGEDTIIGGGQKELGSLRIRDFFHMGIRSFINIADEIMIGDETGLGMDTKLFTHGGYLNELEGFPFQRGPIVIGNNVWLPYAVVLPEVKIGDNVVVAAMSLVNKNLPSGCLAGGIPVKILKENVYPQGVNIHALLVNIELEAKFYNIEIKVNGPTSSTITVGKTIFFPVSKQILGPANFDTERVKDIFRRHGVRFRYYDNGGEYREWD